jgi:DUF4097 and DUF4098 domain-containing protein YvlB
MPTTTHRFDTPGPITLHLRNDRGSVLVSATTTDETTVEITARHDRDGVRVEHAAGAHRVTVEPETRRFGHNHHIDMVVKVPIGSKLEIATASAGIEVRGAVGEVDVNTASGAISLEHVDGHAELGSASGSVRIASAERSVTFRSASGSLQLDEVGGRCQATTASGSITIGTPDDDVSAKSVSGRVEVREAHRGTVELHSTSGSIGVGVRRGTLVWLEVASTAGRVQSNLADDGVSPASDEEPLTVRANSVSGSISISPIGAGRY